MKKLIVLALLASFNFAAADTKAELEAKELTAVKIVKMAQCDKTLKVSYFDSDVRDNGNFMVIVAERSTAKMKPQGHGVEYTRIVTFSDTDENAIVVSGCNE